MEAFLQPEEELLWCSKAESTWLCPESGASLIGGLIFGAISLFCLLYPQELTMWNKVQAGLFLGLFLYQAALLPTLHHLHLKRYLYAITTRRALILDHRDRLRAYDLRPGMVLRADLPEGKPGSLLLEREVHTDNRGFRSVVNRGFLYTRTAAEALRLLNRQLGGHALRSPADRSSLWLIRLAGAPHTVHLLLLLQIALGIFAAVCVYGLLLQWQSVRLGLVSNSWSAAYERPVLVLAAALLANFLSARVFCRLLRCRRQLLASP